MDTPSLITALREKYESLQADFGDKAADRLREVVEHALGQIVGATRTRRGKATKAAAPEKRGRRSWTPAQREAQRKKMQAYWAKRRNPKARTVKRKKTSPAAETAAT